jgi:hypothetical protein
LSELFDTPERKPVQDEVSAMRVLFKLLGFLLNPSATTFPDSIYNGGGISFKIMD